MGFSFMEQKENTQPEESSLARWLLRAVQGSTEALVLG
jgi:hypothetical protein